MLDPVTVIQHAILRDADAVAAQLIHAVALDHLAKLEIHVSLGIITSGLHLFCQRAFLNRLFV